MTFGIIFNTETAVFSISLALWDDPIFPFLPSNLKQLMIFSFKIIQPNFFVFVQRQYLAGIDYTLDDIVCRWERFKGCRHLGRKFVSLDGIAFCWNDHPLLVLAFVPLPLNHISVGLTLAIHDIKSLIVTAEDEAGLASPSPILNGLDPEETGLVLLGISFDSPPIRNIFDANGGVACGVDKGVTGVGA